MPGLYGTTTKYLRHVTDDDYIIEPQRARLIPFWYCDNSVTTPLDGADVQTKGMKEGSKVSRHKLDMTIEPTVIEPQRIYMGILKLSFHDVMSFAVNGIRAHQTAYQGAITETSVTSYLQFYSNNTDKRAVHPTGQIDTSGIDSVRLDDYFKHFVKSLKKITVFDQRPLMSERFHKVPAKVKRVNEFTWYGMWVFNDSDRGATPSDTQVTLNVKQFFQEYAL
jgi:hypothetical protein